MTRKARAREWEPVGLEARDQIFALYTDEVMGRIAWKASVSLDTLRARIGGEIEAIAALFLMHHRGEQRPKPKEVKAALTDLGRMLHTVLLQLETLDADTRDQILQQAATDDWDVQTEPDPKLTPLYPFAETRLAHAENGVHRLARWVTEALAEVPDAAPGAPRKEALFDAVTGLARAWTALTGTPPARNNDKAYAQPEHGAFRAFANAALAPLGQSVSDDMAKRAIAARQD